MTGITGLRGFVPPATALGIALASARKNGWSLLPRSISHVVSVDLAFPYGADAPSGVPHRRGGNLVADLKPTAPEDAAKRSLSAVYGTGAFPFHTDGAYMKAPPEFVLLEAVGPPSSVPTTLIKLSTVRDKVSTPDLTLGMFRVQEHGGSASYRPALDSGVLRFDTECMSAADPRSRRVVAATQELAPDYEHAWDTTGVTLVIHNHSVLHARGTATDEPDRLLHRLMLNGKH